MARFFVNHEMLIKEAKALERSIEAHGSLMIRERALVEGMSSHWTGDDYMMYILQWERLIESDSTYKAINDLMKAHTDALRYAANRYKEAQSNVALRANRLSI